MLEELIFKIQGISLKGKLLVPSLTASFLGITALVYIGITSQQELIKTEEQKEIRHYYGLFLKKINDKKVQVLSMAGIIANDPRVQDCLAGRDQNCLKARFFPLYERLKNEFAIRQFHFHIPPGNSFLRLHLGPSEGKDMLTDRKTVIEAMKTAKGVAGLERGVTGLGIRGVVPVFNDGKLVGSVEIGYPFNGRFLDELKADWGPDFSVYEKKGGNRYTRLAATLDDVSSPLILEQMREGREGEVEILIAPPQYPNRSVLLGPVKDYHGEDAALLVVDVDRSEIVEKLSHTRNLMVCVGLASILVFFVLIWIVTELFTRPIREIVKEAQLIAEGKRESRLEPRPNDEVGALTHALNKMLVSLKARRMQVQEYARTLEKRVQERTADLVSSEEKYRTLVENLPLIVYRIQPDGTTEFINSYFTEKLGYRIEEVVGNKDFWREKICDIHNPEDGGIFDSSLKNGKELRTERVVRDKAGQAYTFIDRVIPSKDAHGRIRWIDGIMLDITELKDLQERAIRTEEMKILGEISARFAHEIRNPLSTAGGFARRLHEALPKDDPNRKTSKIIVDEVARLEDFLRTLLSSIKPFELSISEVDMNRLLRSLINEMEDQRRAKGIEIETSLGASIPNIPGDKERLERAFGYLLKHALITVPEGGKVLVSCTKENKDLEINIKHRMEGVSDEDLEQFFFPHYIPSKAGTAVLDLSLSKVIVHKHGGKIDVFRDDGDIIVLRVELPIELADRGAHDIDLLAY